MHNRDRNKHRRTRELRTIIILILLHRHGTLRLEFGRLHKTDSGSAASPFHDNRATVQIENGYDLAYHEGCFERAGVYSRSKLCSPGHKTKEQ